MAQFQTDIPDPLRYHLPALLAPGRVAAPTIGVDLLILVGEHRLKGAAMQVQFDDIGGGKCRLWQVGEEEFIDDARTRDADGTLLQAFWVGGHHHATGHARRPHRHSRAIIEAAHDLTFRTLLDLIWGQMQTRLDERMIEHRVLFPAGDKGEASQVGEHSPGAILSIEPEQGAFPRELVRREVARDGREALTQFLPVAPVASIAKRTEPVVAMGLRDNRARTDDLSRACARCSQGHTFGSSDAVVQAGLLSLATHVGGPPHASHQCQRPSTRCPFNPPVPRFASRWSRWRAGD